MKPRKPISLKRYLLLLAGIAFFVMNHKENTVDKKARSAKVPEV